MKRATTQHEYKLPACRLIQASLPFKQIKTNETFKSLPLTQRHVYKLMQAS